MTFLILIVFLGAATLAMPIAHAILVAAMAAAVSSDRVPFDLLVQQMVAQVQSFPLIAIPFFMLTGSLMMGGKLGQAIVGTLTVLVGRWHGGPAQVSVLSSTLFGGVSGSAVADASAIGSLVMPWHRRLGYPMAFSAASLASAATIDIIIPPSIPLILFALSANASIAALFYAGVLPGLLLCGGFMFACWWVGKRRNLPRETAPRDRVAFRRNLWHSAPALALPVLIVIFLRFGFATPTEVSILSTLYAGLVSALMYRDLSLKRLHHAVLEAGLAQIGASEPAKRIITGAVIVVAAGNQGREVSKYSVSSHEKILTVGATGFDDIPMASWPGYSLTTYRQPIGAIVDRTLELLRSPDPGPAQLHTLKGDLVIRDSTLAQGPAQP